MQQSGAQAVIVGDNQKNGLVTMYARGKGNETNNWVFGATRTLCNHTKMANIDFLF